MVKQIMIIFFLIVFFCSCGTLLSVNTPHIRSLGVIVIISNPKESKHAQGLLKPTTNARNLPKKNH